MRENRRHEAALSAPSEQEECVFTGIVEELGVIADREDLSDAARFTVRGPVVTADAGHGDSIAVNGVCLTVVDLRPGEFTVDVMGETLRRSSLSDLAAGSTVNLERAMPANGRFGGHIVQGHVDGTGTIAAVNPSENWTVVRIAVPAALTRYLVEKGSITVDGVSLTVSAVGGSGDDSWFEISLIPTTLNETNLGAARPGTVVNLEVDVIAKYVERLHLGSDTTGTPDVAGAK
ncbi:riboflavin synthase subunit alpha [Gordonia sp. SGD-V-85]|jgi:riboflavin synthase|nr:riboflavin synthase subunit alpha [Gordonia sp. SGD-V-85]